MTSGSEKFTEKELLILICIAAALITIFFLIIRCVSSIWSSLFGEPEYSGPYIPLQKDIIPRYPIPQPQYMPRRRVIAIDTESVSGPGGISMVARVSLVRRDGRFYDRYVKPTSPVTNYRTPYSGIRERDLVNAEDFMQVRWNVERILEGCILVGHDLNHDLNALHLSHPAEDIRDTSEYEPFRNADNWTNSKPKLKMLARRLLGRDIQSGEHNSVEDAKAVMDLYLLVEMEWELAAAYN